MKNKGTYDPKYYQRHKEKIKGYVRKYQEKNPERTKENFDNWRENNREHFNDLMRAQYHRNKSKQYARTRARKIKIPFGQLCQECNERKATQKHHDDYSKPLEVRLLCRRCHNSIHGKKFK